MYSCETASKGACISRISAVENYSANTLMERNKQGGLKIWNFQGHWKNSNWILQELIKNNEDFSVHDQEKHYVEFPGVLALGLKTSEGCNATIMWKT